MRRHVSWREIYAMIPTPELHIPIKIRIRRSGSIVGAPLLLAWSVQAG